MNLLTFENNSIPPDDEMLDNYDFDYSKAQPNRFAPLLAEQNGFIKLQPDIHKVFQTSDQVNNALRALINAIPKEKKEMISEYINLLILKTYKFINILVNYENTPSNPDIAFIRNKCFCSKHKH